MSRADELEKRLNQTLQTLTTEFADLGEELRATLVRSLVHRAVHLAAEGPGVEFCTVVTYLAEMIGHAHKLQHGDNPKGAKHKDVLH